MHQNLTPQIEMKDETLPWSDELIEALKWYQSGIMFHPYTCGNCRDKLGTRFIKTESGELVKEPIEFRSWEGDNWKQVVLLDRELVPTKEGFVCPTCDYKQTRIMENIVDVVKSMKAVADTHPFYTRIDT
jgi:hypothetical protein